MDKIESNSTFKQTTNNGITMIESANLLTPEIISEEAVFTPFEAENCDILNYIKDQSRNFKMISEQFEMETNNLTLSEDFKMVYAKQSNGDTIVVRTEDYIHNELNSYMKKF